MFVFAQLAGALELQVVAEDGAPVGGARAFVYVCPGPPPCARVEEREVGADGRFSAEGATGLRVEAAGYLSAAFADGPPADGRVVLKRFPRTEPEVVLTREFLRTVPNCRCPSEPVRGSGQYEWVALDGNARLEADAARHLAAPGFARCSVSAISPSPACPGREGCPVQVGVEVVRGRIVRVEVDPSHLFAPEVECYRAVVGLWAFDPRATGTIDLAVRLEPQP